MQSCRMRLLMRNCEQKKMKSGDLESIGLMTNFLSLKEMFAISLHGNEIFGVSLSLNS
jgi:hypothetical protein